MNKRLCALLLVFGLLSTAMMFPLSQQEQEAYEQLARINRQGIDFSTMPRIKDHVGALAEVVKAAKKDGESAYEEAGKYLSSAGWGGLFSIFQCIVYNVAVYRIMAPYKEKKYASAIALGFAMIGNPLILMGPVSTFYDADKNYSDAQKFLQCNKDILKKLETISKVAVV